MRFISLVAALAGLSACSPSIPDSAAGVGFSDYGEYQARKQAQSAARAVPAPGAVSDESAVPPQTTDFAASMSTATPTAAASAADDSAALAAETRAALAATRANSGQAPLQADPSNPPPETVTTAAGISSENDFAAVGNARTIESDAELLARNRAQYQVIQPTALPARSGATGPNVVEYALSTRHPVGTKVWNRVGINKEARYRRNCANYASADLAQIDFLSSGGPRRDKLGLDPDGDGYACGWDPTPFRKAVSG